MKRILLMACFCLLCWNLCAADDAKLERAARDARWKSVIAMKRSDVDRKVFQALRFPSDNPGADWDAISNEPAIQKAGAFEIVRIPTRDGAFLDGWFFPVENARGTVVVVHGWGSDAAFGLYQSKFLQKAGYQLLVWNHRSWNFSQYPETYTGNLQRDIDDVQDAFRFALSRPEVDSNRVAILGFSYGAYLSVLTAALEPGIRSVAVDAGPAPNLVDFWFYGSTHVKGLKEEALKTIRQKTGVVYQSELYNSFKQVKKIAPRPVLFLHGEKDAMVPLDCSRSLYAAANEPKQLITFPQSGHCLGMWTSDKNSYRAALTNFFEETFH